jgi:hypothetical protein
MIVTVYCVCFYFMQLQSKGTFSIARCDLACNGPWACPRSRRLHTCTTHIHIYIYTLYVAAIFHFHLPSPCCMLGFACAYVVRIAYRGGRCALCAIRTVTVHARMCIYLYIDKLMWQHTIFSACYTLYVYSYSFVAVFWWSSCQMCAGYSGIFCPASVGLVADLVC